MDAATLARAICRFTTVAETRSEAVDRVKAVFAARDRSLEENGDE